MKRLSVLLAIALLAGLPAALSADAYDKEVVVQAMRDNVARMSVIKNALAAQDFHAAGKAFFEYGDDAAALAKLDPPKGSKEEWIQLWAAFQDKSFQGVGACGDRDAAKSLEILNELGAFAMPGHSTFR